MVGDDKYGALRQLLNERCPGAEFENDDVKKLVDAGYTTAATLAAATKDDLNSVLSGRVGVVALLLKKFVQPTGSFTYLFVIRIADRGAGVVLAEALGLAGELPQALQVKRNALLQVLKERCLGAEFENDDVKKLVDAGYTTAATLAAATTKSLTSTLPGRYGIVDVLLKTFGATAVEETSAKRQRTPSRLQIEGAIRMDFDLKDCDICKWKIGTLVSTAGMSKVMESFGGFPPQYYVRQEEIYVFETICSRYEASMKFAILGSPGVGKSAFLVFLAFYLASIKSRNILLLRRVNVADSLGYTSVVLSRGFYREVKFNLNDISGVWDSLRKEFPGFWLFVDGFTQEEVKLYGLSGFRILATSSQFSRKSDDPTTVVVLPAWQFRDLEDFALKAKVFPPGVNAEKSRDFYYFSGGSLREFCARDLAEVEDRVADNLTRVGETAQALMLMGEHGGTSDSQVDCLRRRYLNDPKDKEQYKRTASKFVVDSSYVLRRLLRQCDKEQFEKVYNFAKAFGGAFHGWAFEAYLHKLATSGGFTIQAKEHLSAGPRVQYEINCSEPTSEGTSEVECMTSLRSWASNEKSTYWYPEYPRFPNIDSVAKLVRKTTGETVIAYIQITIGEAHALNGKWMDELDEIFKARCSERIYVAIQPKNLGSDQKFTLNVRPKPAQVLVYEAFFEGCLND